MDTKRAILTTARDLFSRSGYEAVGIQQICNSAGITKPSLYYHFRNKETLLAEVIHDAASGLLDTWDDDNGIPFSGDLVSDVRALFTAVLRFSREHPSRFQIILQMLYPARGSVFSRVSAPELHRIHAALEAFFHIAAHAHGNLSGKERFLAIVFIGHAIALEVFLSHGNPAPKADSPEVVQAAQTFLYGVF